MGTVVPPFSVQGSTDSFGVSTNLAGINVADTRFSRSQNVTIEVTGILCCNRRKPQKDSFLVRQNDKPRYHATRKPIRASDADLREVEYEPRSPKTTSTLVDRTPRDAPHSHFLTSTFQYIPLSMSGNGGSHGSSEASRLLLEYEVTFDDLRRTSSTSIHSGCDLDKNYSLA